ncbi:MAG: DNA polymerase [Acinetobacter sp.]
MQVVGTVDSNTIWVFTLSSFKSRWNMYSTESLDLKNTLPLDPLMLQTKSLGRYNEYLLASAVCSTSGVVSQVYGNIELIYNLIATVTEAGVCTDALTGEIAPRDYTDRVVVVSVNTTIGSVNKLTALEYKQCASQQRQHLKAFRYTIGKSRIKTYEQVLEKYNTSWMYDKDHKLIKDYRLITTLQEWEALKQELTEINPPVVAFDTETTGLKFFYYPGFEEERSVICGCSISWKVDQGIYIVFKSNVCSTVPVSEVFDWLVPFINLRTAVAHNAPFDARVLYSLGYHLKLTDDTLLMEFNLNPNVDRSKGLKMLTRKYYQHETLELEDIMGANPDYSLVQDIDERLLKIYACADTDYCLRLFFDLGKEIKLLSRQSYAIDRKLIDIITIADFYGSRIDTELLDKLNKVNNEDIETLESLMWEYVRDIGAKTQAVEFIKMQTSSDYEPTQSEILDVISNDNFKDLFETQMKKQAKSRIKDNIPLQFTSDPDIRHIIYDILRYPVEYVEEDTHEWSTADDTLQRFLDIPAEEPIRFLSSDVKSAVCKTDIKTMGTDQYLLMKADFESYQYPFAYMLRKWRELNKLQDSFFGPLLESNIKGWYYTTNSMTSAETARVINPIQTLKGSLKKLVIPYSNDYYAIVFDLAQIEFRIMIGLANGYWHSITAKETGEKRAEMDAKNLDKLVEKLNDPETDYHREGGAIFAGCTPEDMTSEQRSKVKAIHFSVPFGAGAYSIAAEKLRHAKNDNERTDVLTDMEATLAAWRKNLYPLYYYLEHKRDEALIALPDSRLPSALKGGQWGCVTNPMGRTRYMDVSDLDRSKIGRIRRQVGNFPIQSLAREVFFTAIRRLFLRLRKEGLITERAGEEKVIIHNFVHDEATLQVHKSIHPYRLYQMLLDELLVELPGYPKFYMGISIVGNWYDGKNDTYEAPIRFVQQQAQAYKDNPAKYEAENLWKCDIQQRVLDDLKAYMASRFYEYVVSIQKDTADPYLIVPSYFCSHFKNYFLKSRVKLYTTPIRSPEFCKDATISKDDMKVLTHIDAYIKTYSPEEYSKYRTIINGKEYYLYEIEEVKEEDPFDGLLDNVLGNLDESFELTDSILDYEDIEEKTAAEYYTLTSESRTIKVVSTKRPEDDTYEERPVEESNLIVEDFDGRYVCDVTGVDSEGITALVAYLRKFRSDNGKPLWFLDTSIEELYNSGGRMTDEFSQSAVRDICVKHWKPPATKTTKFG